MTDASIHIIIMYSSAQLMLSGSGNRINISFFPDGFTQQQQLLEVSKEVSMSIWAGGNLFLSNSFKPRGTRHSTIAIAQRAN